MSQLRKTLPMSKDGSDSPRGRDLPQLQGGDGRRGALVSFIPLFSKHSTFCTTLYYSWGGGDVISECLTKNFGHIHQWIMQQYLPTEKKEKTLLLCCS